MLQTDEELRFTAEEIVVAIQALQGDPAELPTVGTSELATILYTGLERSGAGARLQGIAERLGVLRQRSPIEIALHFGFQLGFRVRSDLMDAGLLHALYELEGNDVAG